MDPVLVSPYLGQWYFLTVAHFYPPPLHYFIYFFSLSPLDLLAKFNMVFFVLFFFKNQSPALAGKLKINENFNSSRH